MSTVSLREGRYSTQNHLVGGCAANAWKLIIFGDHFPKFPGAKKKIFFITVAGPVWWDGLCTPLVSFTYTLRIHGTAVYVPTWTVWTPKPRTHALKIMGHNHWNILVVGSNGRYKFASWWFQPIWKLLYSQTGNLPQMGVNNKKSLKPPPRLAIVIQDTLILESSLYSSGTRRMAWWLGSNGPLVG